MVMTVEKQTAYKLYRYVPDRGEFLKTFRRVERAVKPFGKALPVALRRVGPPHPALMVLRNLDLIYELASEMMPDRPVAFGERQVEVPAPEDWNPTDPLPFDTAGWYSYVDPEHDWPWNYDPDDWNYSGVEVFRFSNPGHSSSGVANVYGAAPFGTFNWDDMLANPAKSGVPFPDAWYIGHYHKYDHDPASPQGPFVHPSEEFWWVNEVENGPRIWTGPTKFVSRPGAIVLPPWRQVDPNRMRAKQPDKTVIHRQVVAPSLERIVEVVPATQPQPQPLPQPTRRAPPMAGEREKKTMPRSRRLGLLLVHAMDRLSESAEVVDAVYDALPKDVKRRWSKGRKDRPLADQAGQYGIDGADWKLQAIYHNWHRLDAAQAVENIVKNEIEDRIYGGIYRGLPVNTGRALDPSFKGLADLMSEVL